MVTAGPEVPPPKALTSRRRGQLFRAPVQAPKALAHARTLRAAAALPASELRGCDFKLTSSLRDFGSCKYGLCSQLTPADGLENIRITRCCFCMKKAREVQHLRWDPHKVCGNVAANSDRNKNPRPAAPRENPKPLSCPAKAPFCVCVALSCTSYYMNFSWFRPGTSSCSRRLAFPTVRRRILLLLGLTVTVSGVEQGPPTTATTRYLT